MTSRPDSVPIIMSGLSNSGLRQRRKPVTQVITDFDAFPKVPETYVEQTATGGYVSIITFSLVMLMLYSELNYFLFPGYKFRFAPDADFLAKLKLNVDMTVAMPCDLIGADILDKTGQNAFSFGRLREEPTWWELDSNQRIHFDEVQKMNQYLREEYHQLQDILWGSGYGRLYSDMPVRRIQPTIDRNACRVHGSLTLNKVAGNFHITAGKVLPIMGAHAHMTGFMEPEEYNFTHRIEKLSFGDKHAGIIQPLEGDEKTTDIHMMNFQYFIEVVPTEVWGFTGKKTTYQYSVKEHTRPIDHTSGSHGTPGIYFKYDLSALKVEVTKDREGLIQFLVRLCASVGGLVATSHIVCSLVKHLVAFVCCYSMPESPKKSSLHTPSSLSSMSSVSTSLLSQSAPLSSKQTLVSSPNVSITQVNNIELTKSC